METTSATAPHWETQHHTGPSHPKSAVEGVGHLESDSFSTLKQEHP